MKKILVIDDERQIRKLLKISYEANGFSFISADSGNGGLILAATEQPDLILLDLGLPDIDGQTVLKNLREWYTKSIIVLTVVNDNQTIVECLNFGADDYVTKPFVVSELIARTGACLRRYDHLNDSNHGNPVEILTVNDVTIDLNARTVFKNGSEIHLTNTEYDLLVCLFKNRGKILTTPQILKLVWGTNKSYKELQYVKVYIRHLRQKIEDDPKEPKIIQTEMGVGYRVI